MATKKTKTEKTVPVAKVQELVEQQAQAAPAAEAPKQEAPQPGQVQVNVDFLRTTKVHIAMPCYGGMLTESTFMSFIKWANTARQLGISTSAVNQIFRRLASMKSSVKNKYTISPMSPYGL